MRRYFGRAAMTVAFGFTFGCGSHLEGNHQGDSLAEVKPALAVKLASIRLSDTHTIEFLEYPELNLAGVREKLNVDLDGVEARLTGLHAGKPLDELYLQVSGDQRDQKVYARLQKTQALISAAASNRATTQLSQGASKPIAAPPFAGRLSEEALAARSGSEIGKAMQTYCNEPDVDWLADDQWFKGSYCAPDYQYCHSLNWTHTAEGAAQNLHFTFFNQSHCESADWRVWYYTATACDIFGCTRRWFHVDSNTLPPRALDTGDWYFTGPDASGLWGNWQAHIESRTDHFTGLALHVY